MIPEVSICSLPYVQVHILTVMGEKKIVVRYSKFNSRAMSSSSWLLVLLHCFPPEPGIIKIPPTCCVTDLQSQAASQGCLDHVCLHKENQAKHFQNKPSEKKEHRVWPSTIYGAKGFRRPSAIPESNVGFVALNFQWLGVRAVGLIEWISPLQKYLETNESVSFACLRIISWKSVVKLLSFGEICLIFF